MVDTLERVLVETDVQGFLVSWNTQCHSVVGTDIYYVYSLDQRKVIMDTIQLYCPARGRPRLVNAMDLLEDHHGTVFMKIADTGAFSFQIGGRSWDKLMELEQAFSPRGLVEYLRKGYVTPPNVFSMCYTADCTPYCSAYMNQWIEL